MRLIIHDLTEPEYLVGCGEEAVLLGPEKTARACTGCFGCWVRTPGACVIRDGIGDMGRLLAQCRELWIVTRYTYGGYSPEVKRIIDRSIPYLHPDFRIKGGEMHHKRRYPNRIRVSVWFYGEGIRREERETAERLVRANAVNLDAEVEAVRFLERIGEWKGGGQ